MPPGDADGQFLRMASELAGYGVHRYTLAGKQGGSVGISAGGIIHNTYHPWGDIKNVDHDGSKFVVKLHKNVSNKKKIPPFKFQNAAQAKAVWRDAVDQHEFYKNSDSRRKKVKKSDSITR